MYELGLHTYYWRVGLSVFSVLFAGSEALSLGSTPGLNLLHVCYHSPHRGKRLKTRMKYTVHTIKCGYCRNCRLHRHLQQRAQGQFESTVYGPQLSHQ